MGWQQVIEQTVVGLGYELVDLERSTGGLLRVTIDWPWDPAAPQERYITVDDCERVTRQLQYVLEVEGVDYKRLEVGSPGIDRPLRQPRDYERFVGEVVDVTLRAPIGAAAGGAVAPGRKKFRGTLRAGEAPGTWQLELLEDEAAPPGGAKPARRRGEPTTVQVLGFTLDEVREARLAPIVDFKGRRARGAAGQG
ncbi:ribosome maturation factor RimP [Tepidimonas taiwanensis]|uniref:Ribosome maturation factor RimP n=1 Tax=Tepidimonas taiwanensis TaxID=307486 RepID=A0A554X9N4_9BURK|nr:ribosome maturation factor RimP [Tepidimonas taiwanensis]MCX7692319.1 ribosome maturation factor RimP [Tepidimonas taiwanensis]MDM7462083.1 ribosome maturation factor RimP [Tepidimonas taiwanensis]TSE32555.1 Ribosome maturation factor RimP [Tepidimonas taiwanensis]UBQ06453.1 ribosome maturation factor RimP [Tepidimonas taiwanensis]